MDSESEKSCSVPTNLDSIKSFFRKYLRSPLVSMALGLLAAWFLPQLLGEEFGTRIAARAFAPWVGENRGAAGRDKVSVLLIDDRSLANAGQLWPASYGYYARLLDGLVQYHPKAVFLDVVFASERNDPSIARLTDSLCKARKEGVRVYLAARRNDMGSFVLRPELQALVPRCIQTVAIEYQPDSMDQVAWTYPISPEKTPEGTQLLSAAASIYKDEGGTLPVREGVSLAVNWGLVPADLGIEWQIPSAMPVRESAANSTDAVATTYTSYCRQPKNRWLETLSPDIRANSFENADVRKPICVFHHTLYPADLSPASTQDEKRLEDHVHDRIVMVGTALQGSNDRVTSPLHGNIPGVYLHAAAMDNLLFYGDSFKRNFVPKFDREVKWLALLVFLSTGFMTIAGYLRKVGKEILARNDHWKVWRKWHFFSKKSEFLRRFESALAFLGAKVASFFMSVFFFALMIWMGQDWFDLGLLTVASVAIFAFAADWLEWGDKLVKWYDGTRRCEHCKQPIEAPDS